MQLANTQTTKLWENFEKFFIPGFYLWNVAGHGLFRPAGGKPTGTTIKRGEILLSYKSIYPKRARYSKPSAKTRLCGHRIAPKDYFRPGNSHHTERHV